MRIDTSQDLETDGSSKTCQILFLILLAIVTTVCFTTMADLNLLAW